MQLIGAGAGRRAAALLAALLVAVAGQLLGAGPASAHAELVTTDPANGATLADAPSVVTLTFTESVGLVQDGIRLLDGDGNTIETAAPRVDGAIVRWEVPHDLADGAYVVTWRVVSGDSHPIAGAFSFGVGDATVAPVRAGEAPSTDAPWPVVAARFGGYLGFVLVAGVATLALLCWPGARSHGRLAALLRLGAVVAAVSSVVTLLLHGPYVAGRPLTELLSRDLLAETSHSPVGAWVQIRLFVVVALAAVLWPAGSLEHRSNRWIAGGGVIGLAATFSGTAHAAASGDVVERVVDSAHALTAGLWVGGVIALVVAVTAPGARPAAGDIGRFSRLALWAVVVLIATGTVNAVYRIDSLDSLWDSGYGRLLLLKVALLALALGGAAMSRRSLRGGTAPSSTIRLEAGVMLAVVAVTAVLASVPPPSTTVGPVPPGAAPPATSSVTMPLRDGNTAEVQLEGVEAEGGRVTVTLLDPAGKLLPATAARLRASSSERDVGPLDIILKRGGPGTWRADFRFPFPGTWTLTLTVEDRQQRALVTTGEVVVAEPGAGSG